MKYSVVIPAYNEADFIEKALSALFSQELLPQEVLVVDDHSTDATPFLVKEWIKTQPTIKLVQQNNAADHQPGAKVVHAFLKGESALTKPYDVLVKLDADIELPSNYFAVLASHFQDRKAGIVGGLIEEKKDGEWQINHPMNQDHVRGAIKAYSKQCYKAIGGLKPLMGWDTLDEHLARFYGYKVLTVPTLMVKHYRPLGERYSSSAIKKQGRAFYLMRYGAFLSLLAALKHAKVKRSTKTFFVLLRGYFSALISRPKRVVSKKEGRFIRKYRYAQIKMKLKSF